MQAKDKLGRYGETLAARILTDAGFRILHRNWRCRHGEIDIVAADDTTLVICEVKTRSSDRFGQPSEAVDRSKSSRLRLLAAQYLLDNPGHWDDIRFDVISILRGATGPARAQHLRGAF